MQLMNYVCAKFQLILIPVTLNFSDLTWRQHHRFDNICWYAKKNFSQNL